MAAKVVEVEDGEVELHTKRLRLRGAIQSDAEHLHEAFKDAEVMRYWSEPPHTHLDRTSDWISIMRLGRYNGVSDFIICLKPDDKPIGKIGVWSDDEIGFLLDRRCWHKGLAKEALHAIIPQLFDARKLESITADIDPRNEASIGILKKVGFEVERLEKNTMQVGEDWVDSLYLRLTKERWNSQTFSCCFGRDLK